MSADFEPKTAAFTPGGSSEPSEAPDSYEASDSRKVRETQRRSSRLKDKLPDKTHSPKTSPEKEHEQRWTLGLHRSLLSWYASEQRDLPWRRGQAEGLAPDPYGVWISEIMLQQTQVLTVIPYWERFLKRFPSVFELASAPVDEVLALWTGLGYYARARHLHRAAQLLVERHGGEFPADLKALSALPGFGPYTTGAVASIALGLDAAAVDGNVARVFCRLQGWELNADEARAKAWPLAEKLLPKGRCGQWNQALMELGATVCRPRKPLCTSCPVAEYCTALQSGEPERFPLPKVRAPRKFLRLAVLALQDPTGKLLMRKRSSDGLFGGLWELPSLALDELENPQYRAQELALKLEGSLGAEDGDSVSSLRFLGTVSRTLTHRQVEADVFGGQWKNSAPPRVSARAKALGEVLEWVAPDEIGSLGLSSFALETLKRVREGSREG